MNRKKEICNLGQYAINEVETKSFGTTKQILAVHEVYRLGGKPTIVKIEEGKTTSTVYFQIVGEKFYFAAYFSMLPKVSLTGTGTEPHTSVYLNASSYILTYKEICAFTSLIPTRGWSVGDMTPSGKSTRKFSSVQFEESDGPGLFSKKLRSLLDFLERDKLGVLRLVTNAEAYVQTVMEFHNGNTMLGGPNIDKISLRRLSDFELDIDFDFYATGNFFKEE
jgi:hypothetical protein